jgi:hypothetical protein
MRDYASLHANTTMRAVELEPIARDCWRDALVSLDEVGRHMGSFLNDKEDE